MNDPTTREVLTRTADMFKRGGWSHRAIAVDKNSHNVPIHSPQAVRFCLAAGIARTVGQFHPPLTQAYSKLAIASLDAVRDQLAAKGELRTTTLGPWNSDPERTAEEVISVLRKTALESHTS